MNKWKLLKTPLKKKRKKVAKIPEKSDVLFLLPYLPPLSDFVPIWLDPPSPPKIGHHLCTFPYDKLENFDFCLSVVPL